MREQNNPNGKTKKIPTKVWQILFMPLTAALEDKSI